MSSEQGSFLKEGRLPTINFQVWAVGFRGSRPCSDCNEALAYPYEVNDCREAGKGEISVSKQALWMAVKDFYRWLGFFYIEYNLYL